MISEEEKKAIGNLKIIAEYIGENYFFGKQGIENLKKDINVTLNYLNHLQKELDKKDKVMEELKSKLKEHINFCEQEAKGHLTNNVCHISLKHDKHLLEILKKVEEENE